ncbi:hypothetical protein SOVF_148530, partial [Spinacia oleracea]
MVTGGLGGGSGRIGRRRNREAPERRWWWWWCGSAAAEQSGKGVMVVAQNRGKTWEIGEVFSGWFWAEAEAVIGLVRVAGNDGGSRWWW